MSDSFHLTQPANQTVHAAAALAEIPFNKGDTVYSLEGDEAEYVARVPSGHVVLPVYRDGGDDDCAPWPSDEAVTWGKVFAKPPVPVFHEEVVEARAKLRAVEDELMQ